MYIPELLERKQDHMVDFLDEHVALSFVIDFYIKRVHPPLAFQSPC